MDEAGLAKADKKGAAPLPVPASMRDIKMAPVRMAERRELRRRLMEAGGSTFGNSDDDEDDDDEDEEDSLWNNEVATQWTKQIMTFLPVIPRP